MSLQYVSCSFNPQQTQEAQPISLRYPQVATKQASGGYLNS